MLQKNYFITVLVASICAIGDAQRVRMPSNIRKCRPDDGACLSHIFTKLIQNSTEYPDFNIPDLRLYQPQQTWKQQTPDYNSLKIAKYTAYLSDIFIHGLSGIQVHHVSGIGPQIYAELSIPWLKFASRLLLDVNLLSMLRFPVDGDVVITVTNIGIPIHISGDVIERSGAKYVQIKNIDLSVHFEGDFKIDVKFSKDVPEIVKCIMDEQIQSNWRQIKPLIGADIKKYVSEIVYDEVSPIFDKMSIQGFFL